MLRARASCARAAFSERSAQRAPRGIPFAERPEYRGAAWNPATHYDTTPRQEHRPQTEPREGESFVLHAVQQESHDEVVRGSTFNADAGAFDVPGRTAAAFVEER